MGKCHHNNVFIEKNVNYVENVNILYKRMTYFNVCD